MTYKMISYSILQYKFRSILNIPIISLDHRNLASKMLNWLIKTTYRNSVYYSDISWSTSGLKAYVPSKEFLYLKKKKKNEKKKIFFFISN